MKRTFFLLSCLLTLGLTLLTSCAKAPTIEPTAEISQETKEVIAAASETEPAPLETEPSPTPTPTEKPVLPCNITFDSDRDGNLEIFTMNPDGANQVNLTRNPADDTDPVWSPDGTHIAFVSNRENENDGGLFIYVMSADGSEVTRISHENDSRFPDWSPTGSQIAFSGYGDIFLADISQGTEVNLTNSLEYDEQPKFSPDGQQIAWLKEIDNTRQIFIMDLNGENMTQVTHGGYVHDIEWTTDGRLFTHWEQPDGICFNCVVTADGSEVIDAGGKGAIQEFLPFWTVEGDRVELGYGDVNGTGYEDIFLVGEIYPDIFMFLTSSSGNNRNPDTAALCGPSGQVADRPSANEAEETDHQMVIGYTGSIDPRMQMEFDQACSELDISCVHGDSITELAGQGVDAIVNASNRWDAMGSYPQIHETASGGIPIFMLNAESSEPGVYNLSAENQIYTTTLAWMFKTMNGQGDFVYYNFGKNDYIQYIIDGILREFPDINVTAEEASYDQNPFVGQAIQNLIQANPNLGAIWSSEPSNDLFWAVVDKANAHTPLIECPARQDMLEAWQNELDAGSDLQCISFIRPGGTAYEGIYVAYYVLSGYTLNPDILTGEGHNTLHYALPEITNNNLLDWLHKLDSFSIGENQMLQLPPMSPDEILSTWFTE